MSNEVLLDGALAVVRRAGPDAVTFAAVAEETGLSPATLVQRFGSKNALLQAALMRAWDLLDAATAAAIESTPETPAGAIDLVMALSEGYDDDDYAQGLLLLKEDISDPDLRRRGAAWGRTLAEALGRRLADRNGPRLDLGRLMAAQWQGTILLWGFERNGTLQQAVEEALRRWCAVAGIDVD